MIQFAGKILSAADKPSEPVPERSGARQEDLTGSEVFHAADTLQGSYGDVSRGF